MVVVECTVCNDKVDLGTDSTGTYECPYCNEDFKYESEAKGEPVLLGKRDNNPWPLYVQYLIGSILSMGIFTFFWITEYIFMVLPERRKWLDEYEVGYLNPNFLTGTGLLVYPNLDAQLLAPSWVPAHKFGRNEITSVSLHQEYYDMFFVWRREMGSTVNIFLNNHHALTIVRLNKTSGEDIVFNLCKLYKIDYNITRSHIKLDSGGGGGGG